MSDGSLEPKFSADPFNLLLFSLCEQNRKILLRNIKFEWTRGKLVNSPVSGIWDREMALVSVDSFFRKPGRGWGRLEMGCNWKRQ